MAGILGEFFLVSVSHETKHEKKNEKFGESSENNSGQNPGRKFEKFGELSFCNFSDLSFCRSLYQVVSSSLSMYMCIACLACAKASAWGAQRALSALASTRLVVQEGCLDEWGSASS